MQINRMKVFEFDLQVLREMVELLDRWLRQLEFDAKSSPDPDASSIYDRGEYAIGLGFVAFQNYLTAVAGSRRNNLLDSGPAHRCGKSFARICNEVANYWKHRDEWRRAGSPHKAVQEVFASLGINLEAEYGASNALGAMVKPLQSNLGTVLPFLVQWTELVIATPEME
jgi:hypothetical protein